MNVSETVMSNLLYDALMLGRNKKLENEEFQVAQGLKQPAAFRAENENILISNVISDGEFCVQLIQSVPGYLEIEVICNDNFIIFDRKVITTDDFKDGKFEFRFMIISDRLHNGRNYSEISFVTARQTIKVQITIDNKIRVRLPEFNPRRRVLELERLYIDRHFGKMEVRDWANQSLEVLSEDVSGDDEQSLNLMLYKAQAYISLNDDVHARNYIEYVGTQIPKLENKNYDLYCYFIYLASLYEEVEGVKNCAVKTDIWNVADNMEGVVPFSAEAFHRSNIMDMTALQKVRWVYYHNPSWNILCMLLYMDPYIRSEKRFLIREMRRLFYDKGEVSRVMYMEALKLYSNDISFMQTGDDFEVQVINFALKYDFLSPEMADRFAELVLKNSMSSYSSSSKMMIIRILKESYKKYAGSTILKALLGMLISADIRELEDHHYFERALSAGIEDEKIFDYFIYTLDENTMDPVPESVLKYFLDKIEVLYDYRKYFYANIVVNKYAFSQYYNECISAIVKFAERQMLQGHNDEILSVIYKDLIDNKQLTGNMRNNLYDVLCTKKISVSNERMHSVLVFHKELQIYQESILRDGKAYVKVYSSDALILFKDTTGNLFRKIEFSIDQLLNAKEYIDVCIKDALINKYMMMGDTLPLLRAYKSPLEILDFFTSKKFAGQYRKGYEQELLQGTISYYAKNSRDPEVYDELIKLKELDMPGETRGILIGIMLKSGQVDEAFEELRNYGTCGLSNEKMAELAAEYIKLHGDKENDVLTMLCEAGYTAAGLNEYIFDYLYKFYNGSIDLMANIYRSCNVYNRPVQVIEERILRKSIKTGLHPEIVPLVFKRYYQNGGSRELIEEYYDFRCNTYLYSIMTGGLMNTGTDDMTFLDFMEADMYHDISFNDECVIAYLLYRMNAAMLDDRQIRNIEMHLKDLVKRGKMLEEFKYYKKYFELPSTLANNIIISAFSEDPAARPGISFEITGFGDVIKGEEEMEEIFRHCFVKYFTLFYGEKVVFSMNGQQSSVIRYSDLSISHDGSRYAAIDEMIRYEDINDKENFYKAIEEFYIKEKLIEYLI